MYDPVVQPQPISTLIELIREENVISYILQGTGCDRKQYKSAGQNLTAARTMCTAQRLLSSAKSRHRLNGLEYPR